MKIIRRILERLSRGIVLKRRMFVNGKPVRLFVSPDSQLQYWKPTIKNDLCGIAERFLTENSNVWDIGANVGVFTFAAASIASRGTVLCVEADTWLVSLLRQSARLTARTNQRVCILPVAVAAQNGVASFAIADRGRASNALEDSSGHADMGGVRETQFVPTLTLDTLLKTFAAPDFVKVDVEGSELMVLQGANALVNKTRPVFYIEVGKIASADVLRIFHEAKYHAHSPSGRVLSDACTFNTFFIPEENRVAREIIQAKKK